MKPQDVLLAGRYGSALFLAARRAKALEEVGKDLEGLAGLLELGTPEVAVVLRSRRPADVRREALRRAAGRKLHPLTDKFLGLLIEKRRLALLPEAKAAFGLLVDEDQKVVRVRVRSATPLTEGQSRALAHDMEKLLSKGKDFVKAVLSVDIDPSLLGGVVVRVGDRMWDLSFKGKLNKLREAFLETN